MTNRWTGDFDAVLELAPQGADRILAAIHRLGDPPPSMPHRGPHFLHDGWFNLPLPGGATSGVRGHMRFQLSTPSLAVPAGTDGSRVRVSADLRTWFQALPGSDPAPEFAHGTLQITAGVRFFRCHGEQLAELALGSSDVEVDFQPKPGSALSSAEVAVAQDLLRDFLRSGLQPVQISVGSLGTQAFSVRDLAFKSLRDGADAAFALLLELNEGVGASTSPQGVREVFLGPRDDATLALGREFVSKILFDLAQAPLSGLRVSGSKWRVRFEASPDPASLSFELLPGRLRATIDGSGSLSGGFSFGFRLTMSFALRVQRGRLELSLQERPGLDITRGNRVLRVVLGLFKGRMIDKVEAAARTLIQAANPEVNRVVSESLGSLVDRLAIPGVELALTRATVDAHAILVGGALDIGPGPGAVASFRPANRRLANANVLDFNLELEALHSWVPGGTIDRFHWFEGGPSGSPVGRQVEVHDRFLARLPRQLATTRTPSYGWPPYTWCLRVHGTRVARRPGPPVPVSALTCGITSVVPTIDVGQGVRLTIAVPDGSGGVLADIDPWGRFRPHAFAGDEQERGLLLVHHGEGEVDRVAKVLQPILARSSQRGNVLLATVITEARAPQYERIAYTRDPEATWRKRFSVERPGDTVLVGPGGRELWRGSAPLEAEVLEKVLAGLPAKTPRPPLQSEVQALPPGALAPEIFMPCGPQLVALRKVRKRETLICFWTSWSEASLKELHRMHARAHSDDGHGPLVLCVNDGEDPELAAEALKKQRLDVTLVADPERKLSRSYGIQCWPTVVRVDASGRVADVRCGLEQELSGGVDTTHCGPDPREDPATLERSALAAKGN